jgi:hypothetical protein
MYRHFQDVAIAIATSLLILMTVPVPGAAATLIPLEVGTMQGDSSAEVYYGVDQGFFAAEGLDVHITAFNNTAAEAAAASSSAVDIANGGVGTLAVARERGILNSVIAPASVYAAGAPTATLVELVSDESRHQLQARDVVLARLLEVLLIEALRSTAGTTASPGLVRGLADERLGSAIRRTSRLQVRKHVQCCIYPLCRTAPARYARMAKVSQA